METYPTDEKIAEVIARWVLSQDNLGKVTDPACGPGTILAEISDNTSKVSIEGIDLDPQATETARDRLPDSANIRQSDFFSIDNAFESVVLDPPISRRFEKSDEISIEGHKRWGIHQYFVLRALDKLEEGGRAALLIPTNELKRYFLDQILEQVGVNRAITVPETPSAPVGYTILLCSKAEEISTVDIISADSYEHLAAGLIFKDETALEQTCGIAFQEISLGVIQEQPPVDIFILPQLVNLADSDAYTSLERYFEFKTGVVSSNNDVYYIDEEYFDEVETELLTPLVKTRPEGFRIGESDIDKYFLDLAKIVDRPLSKEDLLEYLDEKGYSDTGEYLETKSLNGAIPPDNQRKPSLDPIIIKPCIEHDKFYYVEPGESVLYDSNYIGMDSSYSEKYVKTLWQYLNTNIHRQITSRLQTNGSINRNTIKSLSRQQVPKPRIIGELKDELGDANLESRRGVIEVENKILDALPEDDREILEEFREHNNRLKWAWLLSEDQFEKFQAKYKQSTEDGLDFIANRIDPANAQELIETLERTTITDQRKKLLRKTMVQFREGEYELFIMAAFSQFEGLLIDIATQNGWEIDEEVADLRKNPEQTCSIKLSELVHKFVDDDFAHFVDDMITSWRNDVAHGRIDINTEHIANITFCALAALVIDYEKYLEAAP